MSTGTGGRPVGPARPNAVKGFFEHKFCRFEFFWQRQTELLHVYDPIFDTDVMLSPEQTCKRIFRTDLQECGMPSSSIKTSSVNTHENFGQGKLKRITANWRNRSKAGNELEMCHTWHERTEFKYMKTTCGHKFRAYMKWSNIFRNEQDALNALKCFSDRNFWIRQRAKTPGY